MPTFAEMIGDGLNVLLDAAGQTIAYAGTDIQAVVVYENDLAATGHDAIGAEAIITVTVADVAEPAYRDAVVINGATWTVKRRLSGDGVSWRLLLVSKAAPIPRRSLS